MITKEQIIKYIENSQAGDFMDSIKELSSVILEHDQVNDANINLLSQAIRDNLITAVKLDSKHVNDGSVQVLHDAIRSSKSLETLILSNESNVSAINDNTAKCVQVILQSNKSLTNLQILNGSISGSGIQNIISSVNNTYLSTLKLYSNQSLDGSASHIANMLTSNKSLKVLELGYNITDNVIQNMVNGAKNNSTLTSITVVSGKQIQDAGAEAVRQLLSSQSPPVKYIDLQNTQISDAGMNSISSGLSADNGTLNYFIIESQSVREGCAQALANAIKANKHLTHLGLKLPNIGDAGGERIIQSLNANTNIREFLLSNHQQSDRIAKAVSETLQTNKTITSLTLSNNINDNGVISIAKSLHNNKHLYLLSIEGRQIHDAGAEAVAELLHHNDSLTALSLINTQIKDAGFAAIANGIKNNNSLKSITLDSTCDNAIGSKAVLDALNHRDVHSCTIGSNRLDSAFEVSHYNTSITHLTLNIKNTKSISFDNIVKFLKAFPNLILFKINGASVGPGLFTKEIVEYINTSEAAPKYLDLDYGRIESNVGKSILDALRVKPTVDDFKDHKPYTSSTDTNNANQSKENMQNVLDFFEKIILLRQQLYPGNNIYIAEQLNNLGIAYQKFYNSLTSKATGPRSKTDKALFTKGLELQEKSLEIYKSLDVNAFDLKARYDSIIDVYESLGETEKAFALADERDKKFIRSISPDNGESFYLNEANNNTVSNQDLDEAQRSIIKDIFALIAEGNNRIQDIEEKGILLLGKTGAGKSTLANLLVGKKLVARHDMSLGAMFVECDDRGAPAKISHNKISETKIPNKCKTNEMVIWDCPGFHDTGGIPQEIANAFYIKKLFETTKQLKFILVAPFSSLDYQRGTDFIGTIEQLVNTFNNIEEFSVSVALVVTQAGPFKEVHQVKNAINSIVQEVANISNNTKTMLKYLMKSVFLFRIPTESGDVCEAKVIKDDHPGDVSDGLLVQINNQLTFLKSDPKLANVAISETSKEYVRDLLNNTRNNFKKMLDTITEAVEEPITSIIMTDGNCFIKNHNTLIKPWLPEQIEHEHVDKSDDEYEEYFTALKQIFLLKTVFANKSSLHIDLLIQALEVFTKFTPSKDLSLIIKNYAHVLKQQFDYIIFFNHVCGKSIKKDFFEDMITKCKKTIFKMLAEKVQAIELQKHDDIAYYEKAIEYLNLYQENSVCIRIKAKAYYFIGNIHFEVNNNKQALVNYLEAIGLDRCLPDVYNKVGEILIQQQQHAEAIKYFKVANNSVQIRECFKILIKKDTQDSEIYMKAGDYYASISLYEKARQYYHKASSVTQNPEIKQTAWKKIGSNLQSKEKLGNEFIQKAEKLDFYNFDLVSIQEISDLLGNITEADDVTT